MIFNRHQDLHLAYMGSLNSKFAIPFTFFANREIHSNQNIIYSFSSFLNIIAFSKFVLTFLFPGFFYIFSKFILSLNLRNQFHLIKNHLLPKSDHPLGSIMDIKLILLKGYGFQIFFFLSLNLFAIRIWVFLVRYL